MFEPSITDTATSGYYPVYLFDVETNSVHLSLNQGTTMVRKEFGRLTQKVLSDRAALMRKRIQDYIPSFPVTSLNLGAGEGLGGDYGAGHVLGVTYKIDSVPSEVNLRDDLVNIVTCYRALIFRGGLDFDALTGDAGNATDSVEEQRRYKMHRRIERNSKASRLAKTFHGCICQACGFDFEKRYGAVGSGFIEVHHLVPLSSLTEGSRVRYDIAADFAVLCANCHRMVHRLPKPADLASLISAIRL